MTQTCTHVYDNGGTCNSAAVRHRNFCAYHLNHRARLMRIAQYRARNERFDLKLPPLEDMFAVNAALNQIVEAVAADMLDLKRADFLLKSLRFAAQALKNSDKWPASIAHSDQPPPAIDLASEYALPNDLDLNLSPELAFPSPIVILSGGGLAAAVEGPAFPVGRTELSPMPTVAYCDHGPACSEHTIRADYPETPELAELHEIQKTQGMDAAIERYKQQQRNHRRREVAVGRKRYAAIALEKNMRLAAERLAERKLAERAAHAHGSATNAAEGCPIPPDFGGVGPFPTDNHDSAAAKKPPASAVTTGETVATEEVITA